jgi:bacillithiol biosynthesis cysteine-adding enzyme BshC
MSATAPTSARARVLTEPLGGSSLSIAVQTGRLPAELQLRRPTGVSEWKEHAEHVRRSAASGWLDALRPAILPSGAAAKRLERAGGAEKGIVVTTGQQPGLFGGPLYTLAKALSALALADALERELGIPAAPVFWAATDDADFLEARVAHVADADGLRELLLSERPPAGTPMANTTLGDMEALLEQLRKASGSTAHAEFFELARTAFTSERTLGSAYVRLLRGLLEPLGIAVMDASHEAVREAARPVLLDALDRAGEIAKATGDRAADLRRAGFEPQVEDDRGLSLVFAIERAAGAGREQGAIKRRLSVDEARTKGRSSLSSAALSPNVLLRPVVERALLPTVAYVAGPGELAYFIQANAVATALGREPVVGVPRWSCTIIEPFAARALVRLGIEHSDIKDRHALERRLASASLPASVAAAWKRLQEQVHSAVRDLGAAVGRESLMPPTVIEGLERSLAHRLSRTERRLLAAAKRRDERVVRDIAAASAALFPLGQRQERVLNYIPILARSGDALLEEMRSAAAKHADTLLGTSRSATATAR